MARVTPTVRRAISASALLLALAACGEGTGPSGPQPTSITIASGNFQSARYGAAVTSTPSVLVIGTNGPMAGVTVTFAVVAGGGSVEDASAVTDASGLARPGTWTLGPSPGTNTLRATAGPVSVDITALATSGPPATVIVEAGDNQVWVAGSTLPVRPSVKVTDGTFGVSGVSVTFAVASGNGTVTMPVVNTNAAGVATVGGWKLGNTGTNTLTATVNGIATPVTFTADAQVLSITAVNKVEGDAQQGFSGNYAPGRVTVEILNQFNLPTEGVNVTFSGSGTLSGNVVMTGLNGRATLGGWRFGAGTSQNLTATAGASSATFTATTTAPPASQFSITVRYLGSEPSTSVKNAFANAAAQWSHVIVGDLPDIVLSGGTVLPPVSINLPNAGLVTCIPQVANETIDDMVIYATVRSIDGEGNILGAATPTHVRTSDHTTIGGCMMFDSADLAELESLGRLQDVILHEMGHVLGFGYETGPWGEQLVGACVSSAPYFTGSSARNAFIASRTAAFTDSTVPVEGGGTCQNNGGTRDAHWSEAVLDNELMTGFVEYDRPNPLSAVTAAALRDLGYVVNDAVSDAYSVLRTPGGAARAPGRKLRLNELDVRAPRIVLDHHGNEVRRIMR